MGAERLSTQAENVHWRDTAKSVRRQRDELQSEVSKCNAQNSYKVSRDDFHFADRGRNDSLSFFIEFQMKRVFGCFSRAEVVGWISMPWIHTAPHRCI
jgi:hypothetical protein